MTTIFEIDMIYFWKSLWQKNIFLFISNRMGALPVLLSLLIIATPSASASVLAAKVLLVKGQVSAINEAGNSRPLSRKSDIFVGDRIKTGAKSLVQLRFVDEARMTLRENTEFFIKNYAYKEANKPNKALMRLITGGFRTITGAIGKGNKSAYRVDTSAASIGIRGTHYEVVEESPNVFVMAVWKGGIVVRNAFASLKLGADVPFRFLRVEKGQAPVGLLIPPPALNLPVAEESKARPHRFERSHSRQEDKVGKQDDKVDRHDNAEKKSELAIEHKENRTLANIEKSGLVSKVVKYKAEVPDDKYDYLESSPKIQAKLQATFGKSGAGNQLPYGPDPRLNRFEGQQILNNKIRLAGATLIGVTSQSNLTTTISKPVVGFDFATQGTARFQLDYRVTGGSGVPAINKQVTVVLNKNDPTVSALAADINDDLMASGINLQARNSAIKPGYLEFFTPVNNQIMSITASSRNFTIQGSTRVQDVASALGLTSISLPNSPASGPSPQYILMGIGGGKAPYVERGGAIFDMLNNPVFLIPSQNLKSISLAVNGQGTVVVVPPVPMDITYIKQMSTDIIKRGNATISQQNLHVGGLTNVSWGRWNASTTTPNHQYNDKTHPATFTQNTQPFYWFTAEAAPTANLTGQATFVSTGDVLGVMPDGNIKQISASFHVNFNAPLNSTAPSPNITNGTFRVTSVGQTTWKVGFTGYYEKGQADMKTTSGSGMILNASGQPTCSTGSCVDGTIHGIFVAPNGTHFVGGFDLMGNSNLSQRAQGVFLMKR